LFPAGTTAWRKIQRLGFTPDASAQIEAAPNFCERPTSQRLVDRVEYVQLGRDLLPGRGLPRLAGARRAFGLLPRKGLGRFAMRNFSRDHRPENVFGCPFHAARFPSVQGEE